MLMACSAFVEGRVPGRRVLKAGQGVASSDDAVLERTEDLLGDFSADATPAPQASAAPQVCDVRAHMYGPVSLLCRLPLRTLRLTSLDSRRLLLLLRPSARLLSLRRSVWCVICRFEPIECLFAWKTHVSQGWLPAAKGNGLEVFGSFARRNGQIYMDMTFANRSAQALGEFAIQFNKNSFALSPACMCMCTAPCCGADLLQPRCPCRPLLPTPCTTSRSPSAHVR